MNCTNPVRLSIKNKTGYASWRYPDGLTVPCGKCIFCRIQKRKEWTIRLLHEKEAHDDSIFITLTYSDSNVPDNLSLDKRHAQLFIKRLRKCLNRQGIKYFLCGEYGDKTARPHYHAILFGVSFKDKQSIMDCWPFADWSVSTIRNKSFGLVTADSIRYVAQYIDKKFSGEMAEHEYTAKKRSPVFRLCSLGLGSGYCDNFGAELIQNGYLTVNGVKHSIPRYYLRRMGINSDDLKSSDNAYIKECDVMHKLTGLDISYDEAYRYLNADEVLEYEEAIKKSKAQNEATIKAKLKLKDSKL